MASLEIVAAITTTGRTIPADFISTTQSTSPISSTTVLLEPISDSPSNSSSRISTDGSSSTQALSTPTGPFTLVTVSVTMTATTSVVPSLPPSTYAPPPTEASPSNATPVIAGVSAFAVVAFVACLVLLAFSWKNGKKSCRFGWPDRAGTRRAVDDGANETNSGGCTQEWQGDTRPIHELDGTSIEATTFANTHKHDDKCGGKHPSMTTGVSQDGRRDIQNE